ncbi:hypothetical protein TNCV_1269781 [Trichonephila clavipes]|nr:hypothetical protein TNCV_1269781 [Trichonephila clavipes]
MIIRRARGITGENRGQASNQRQPNFGVGLSESRRINEKEGGQRTEKPQASDRTMEIEQAGEKHLWRGIIE